MQAHLSPAPDLRGDSPPATRDGSATAGPIGSRPTPPPSDQHSTKASFLVTHLVSWVACVVALSLTSAPAATLVVVAYLALAPGDALRTALRVRAPEIHLRILLAVTASVGILMGAAAASRFVVPLVGLDITRSLDPAPVFALVSVVVAICLLAVAADRRHEGGAVPDALDWLTWGVLSGVLVLVCIGAKVLDETGDPVLTATMLAILGAAVVVCAVADSSWSHRLRPSVLFAFVLGVAWSFSQRTNYLFGYDIHQESGWASRTLQAGHWVHTLGDAYGAMLSITTLPAALVSLSGIELVDYFKTFAPLVFGLYVMGVHLFARRFVSDRSAFVATLLVALVPQALWQLPAVSRQEMGLLAFIALLLVLFTEDRRRGGDHVLACGFAAMLAVTHYTTSYVTVGLFVGAVVTSFVVRRVFTAARHSPRFLPTSVVIALLVATIGWNAVYTQSSGNVGAATDKAATQTGLQQRQGGLLESFLDGINATEGTPSEYFAETQVDAEQRDWKLVYSSDVQREFIAEAQARPVPEQSGPLSAVAPVTEPAYVLLRQSVNLLAVVGVGVLLLATIRRFRAGTARPTHSDDAPAAAVPMPGGVPLDLVGLALMALLLTAVTRFNASLAQAYNPERLLLQTGALLAVAIAFAFDAALRGLARGGRGRRLLGALPAVVALGLATAMTLDATGLRAALTVRDAGNLVGDGEYAHRYRVTDGDQDAARWLGNRYRFDDMVFTDSYGVLLTHENPSFRRGMMAELSPYTLDQRGYVLATTENVVGGMARASATRVKTSFVFPREFMSTFKSRIYSNGTAEVYR